MVLSIITFLLGIFGSYLISRNFEMKTQIRMDISSFRIIDDSVKSGGVIIECNGTPIDTLTKTSIMFWNAGRKCITKDDILGEQCLIIEFDENVKIFGCENVKGNEISNNICISSNKNTVKIEFEYLKPGNGAVIDILHNGVINKEIKPYLNLKTYNKSDIIKVETSVGWDSIRRKTEYTKHITRIIMVISCFGFIILATVFSIFIPFFTIDNLDVAILVSLGLEFICGVIFVLLLLYLKNSLYTKPKNLY